MQTVVRVDVVPIGLEIPESGFITTPEMDGPWWTTVGVGRTFFGRPTRHWLREHIRAGHLWLDGEPMAVDRLLGSDWMRWGLHDVEKLAHALAQGGYLSVGDLVRVLRQIRIIAESWEYVPATPIPVVVEPHDPNRRETHAVRTDREQTDDLDGSPDARERRFSVGGVQYVLDLNEEHWHDFLASVAPFVKVARRAAIDGKTPSRHDRSAIRAWGRQHGFKISERGPIPQRVVDAYLRREDT